jgi:putative tryptophan/tyrosine transport system substrate-binding protein
MQFDQLKRREFIALFGGAAAAWPLAARAQQPAMPVIGFLDVIHIPVRLAAFYQGLGESGYVVGQNVAIDIRSAEGRYSLFPELVADLIRRRVSVIVAPGTTPAALAAKAATSTIPIVFGVGDDPVKLGLVASLARPGGNATGINFFTAELAAKRLGLLHELLPAATRVAVLVNPTDPIRVETVVTEVKTAAGALGLQFQVVNASTSSEIDATFARLAAAPPDALFVGPDPFFYGRRGQLALQAARHAIPASYAVRDYAEAGGLMSYGTNLTDAYHQVGVYAGRILKGAKPSDLPVEQSTKFELVINLQAARTIKLDVPSQLLARADEVIESGNLLHCMSLFLAQLGRAITHELILLTNLQRTRFSSGEFLVSRAKAEVRKDGLPRWKLLTVRE